MKNISKLNLNSYFKEGSRRSPRTKRKLFKIDDNLKKNYFELMIPNKNFSCSRSSFFQAIFILSLLLLQSLEKNTFPFHHTPLKHEEREPLGKRQMRFEPEIFLLNVWSPSWVTKCSPKQEFFNLHKNEGFLLTEICVLLL